MSDATPISGTESSLDAPESQNALENEKMYMKDIRIRFPAADADQINELLHESKLRMFDTPNGNSPTLDLQPQSDGSWAYEGAVGLPANLIALSFNLISSDNRHLGKTTEITNAEMRVLARSSSSKRFGEARRIVREFNPASSADAHSVQLVEHLSLSFFVDCDNPGGNVAVVSRGKVISSNGIPHIAEDPSSSEGNPIKSLEQNDPLHLFVIASNLPRGHPNKAPILNVCGHLLKARYRTKGDPQDLFRATMCQATAYMMLPPTHPSYVKFRFDAAQTVLDRYEVTQNPADIGHALEAITPALESEGIAEDPDLHAKCLNEGGMAYLKKYERFSNIEDVDKALALFKSAIDVLDENSKGKAHCLNNLASACHLRYERTNDITFLDKGLKALEAALDLAVEAQGSDHPDLALWLNHLGSILIFKFRATQDLAYLDKGITYSQRALSLDSSNAHSLVSLGILYSERYTYTGDANDVNQGILLHQRAISSSQRDDSDRAQLPMWRNSLAGAYERRYKTSRDLKDISEAITLGEEALEGAPRGHRLRPRFLANQGLYLRHLFIRTRSKEDINKAIALQEESVRLAADDDPARYLYMNNLALSYSTRFKSDHDRRKGHELHELGDINQAIDLQTRVVDFTTPDTNLLSNWLANLGGFYLERYEAKRQAQGEIGDAHGVIDDIDKSVALQLRAISTAPGDHTNIALWSRDLGRTFKIRFGDTRKVSDLESAISHQKKAATSKYGILTIRLDAAKYWASYARNRGKEEMEALEVMVNLITQVAGIHLTIQRRLVLLRQVSTLTNTAAVVALASGEASKALEWLEQGRSMIWQQLGNLRTPLDDLREVEPVIADELERLGARPESAGAKEEFGEGWKDIETSLSPISKASVQEGVTMHGDLAKAWTELVEKVRGFHGFQRFLLPKTAKEVMDTLPMEGVVVIVNADREMDRVDGLVLLPGADDPIHVPLRDMSWKRADVLQKVLKLFLKTNGVRTRDAVSEDVDFVPVGDDAMQELRAGKVGAPLGRDARNVTGILQEIWTGIVNPILQAMAIEEPPIKPLHIRWCTTGPVSFLPIHAAGVYASSEDARVCLSDFAVSSYIPSVSMLRSRNAQAAHTYDTGARLLLVSQPDTPGKTALPGTKQEIEAVQRAMQSSGIQNTQLSSEAATVAAVSESLRSHGWIHLACHALQNLSDPLRSKFFLHDGTMALLDITKTRIPDAEFAFLSACQTGMGDEEWSEEATHLAAGMLSAGYKGAVATLWSIRDQWAPKVADGFYTHLLQAGNGFLSAHNAARALDASIRALRQEVGDGESGLLTWIPFVHYG